MQGVEGIEKLLLKGRLAAERMNVVDQQKIHRAEMIPELGVRLVPQGIHIRIQESFAGRVTDACLRISADHIVGYRLDQMRFSQSRSAVYVDGIQRAGILGRSGGRRIGVTVPLPHHELFEGMARAASFGAEDRFRFVRLGCGCLRNLVRRGCGLRSLLLARGQMSRLEFKRKSLAADGRHGFVQKIAVVVAHPAPEKVVRDAQHQHAVLHAQRCHLGKPLLVDERRFRLQIFANPEPLLLNCPIFLHFRDFPYPNPCTEFRRGSGFKDLSTTRRCLSETGPSNKFFPVQ